jgi:transketolase
VGGDLKEGPCPVLSRQNPPILTPCDHPYPQGLRGGYILAREPTGAAWDRPGCHRRRSTWRFPAAQLTAGVAARVVSLPGWSLFERQPAAYRSEVIPPGIPWLAIEAGTPLGWRSYLDADAPVVGIDHFGASAPGEVLMREFGFTVDAVCERALAMLKS